MSDLTTVSRKRFEDLWHGAKASGPFRARFEELVEHYSEPHRRYHVLGHIGNCLNLLWIPEVWTLAEDPYAVGMSLFYHDIIYDPEAPEGRNEDESGDLAFHVFVQAGVPEFGTRIRSFVIGTKHKGGLTVPDAQLVADIDLSSLAAPWERFTADGENIRYEYRHVPDDAFRTGRNRILGLFLERPNIYQTDHFRTRLEARARANLTRTIKG